VAGLLAFTSIRRGNAGVILLTVAILVLVALNLLFVPGLLDGLVTSANAKLITTYSGDLLVESAGTSATLSNVDELLTQISHIEGVEAATPRTSLGAEIDHGDRRVNTFVYGTQPDSEKRVFSISGYIIEGSALEPDDTDSILLGIQLAGAGKANLELYARSLQEVHAGDEVDVVFANGARRTMTVKGIFQTEFIQTDLQAFITRRELEAVSPGLANRANTIHVKVAAGADRNAVISAINAGRNGLRVMTWEDYAGIVRSMTDSFDTINAILNAVNLLVAGITIFIITYIDVANRKRQIGIQRAIGITPTSITLSYVFRALFYAFLALGLTVLAYIYVVIPVEARYPFHFPFGNVYLRVVPGFIARASIMLFAVSIVAAMIPVRSVMRTKIIDAIWG
jgi:ABC-type lipoprotein release transport system permease subunit